MKQFLAQVIEKFDAPIRYAFAYGSKVFQQKNSTGKQYDLIIVPKTSTKNWHIINYSQYPHHYSSLSLMFLTSKFVTAINQTKPGLYFHPFCLFNNKIVKYGVMDYYSLEHDLLDWSHLYVSGRMHKPILVLKNDPEIDKMNSVNRENALKVALLLINNLHNNGAEFDLRTLYLAITNISYSGDPRMKYGESPSKVSNIVDGQYCEFNKIYGSFLENLKLKGIIRETKMENFKIVNSTELMKYCLSNLPQKINNILDIQQLNNFNLNKKFLKKEIEKTVRNSAYIQTLKGIISAGIPRSSIYLIDKLRKKFHNTDYTK